MDYHEREKLHEFLAWCAENSIMLSEKIKVTVDGTSHRYGVIATETIAQSEVLVQIPRCILLNPETSSVSGRLKSFRKKLRKSGKSLDNTSGWIPLLISLMHEYASKGSRWKPYLDLVPLSTQCGHPMFWEENEVEEELRGLPIIRDVKEDLKNMHQEYMDFVREFKDYNKDLKSMKGSNFDVYKQLVAFVMAYSFSEKPQSPSMVPMADIFNHHSCNNAHLSYRKNHLCMVSTKVITKGEEIFNTFGQLSNSELLHMYGFAESQPNPNDVVVLNVQNLLSSGSSSRSRLRKWKVQVLKTLGLIRDINDGLCFTIKGLSNDPDPLEILKIIHADSREFLLNYGKYIKKLSTFLTKRHFITKHDISKFASINIVWNVHPKRRQRSAVSIPVKDDVKESKRSKLSDSSLYRLSESDMSSHPYPESSSFVTDMLKANPQLENTHASTRSNGILRNGIDIIQNGNQSITCDVESRDQDVISDDDLETITYSFDKLQTHMKPEWVMTIQRSASRLLSELKPDSSILDRQTSNRHRMARIVRQGQRRIIEKILMPS